MVRFKRVTRAAVVGGAAGASLGLLAACSGGGSSDPGPGLQLRPVQAVGVSGPCVDQARYSDPAVLCDEAGVAYQLGAGSLTSAMVSSAQAVQDPSGAWTVQVTLTSQGDAILMALTTAAVQAAPPANQLAAVVDGTVTSAPVVASVLAGGPLTITGNGWDEARARALADAIG